MKPEDQYDAEEPILSHHANEAGPDEPISIGCAIATGAIFVGIMWAIALMIRYL